MTETPSSAENGSGIIELPYIKMWMDGDIICCKYAEDLTVTLEVAKACVEARFFFAKNKSYPLLIDMRGIESISKDAREYLASVGSTFVTAGALITGSLMNRALGNLFLSIDKPSVPTQMFTDVEKGKGWLRQYVNDLNVGGSPNS